MPCASLFLIFHHTGRTNFGFRECAHVVRQFVVEPLQHVDQKVRCPAVETQDATAHAPVGAYLDQARSNVVAGRECLGAGNFQNLHGRAAPKEIASNERAARRDVAHLILAHDRRAERLHVTFGAGAFGVTTPLQILVNDVAILIGARHEVFERADVHNVARHLAERVANFVRHDAKVQSTLSA